ncbi:MAG: LPS export ABC transporter periplasmic protein LptC [Bacteroides sp.]|nr:LPS export ABC transporter periplasmic protein LptC [Bacteroides sp.]MCM1413021.1 LPS export ABC transporter periplasmic protein LptC [Bacteroides sp.]MCM1471727.1 LPS export ABC transporter periplasmic protein LptC [Bacteroides sp.]
MSSTDDPSLRRRPAALMRLIPALLAAAAVLGMPLAGCEDEHKEIVHGNPNPETTPTMTTTDVETLISDSGVVRYKITTPLWYMYDEAAEPRWTFPEGVHLEKFDLKLKPEAYVECDSAIFWRDKQLWRLDGYVNIRNLAGEKFLTNQLYWDQRQQKVYSDSFIHIERAGKIIEGYGFESNEQMTRYHVLRVAAIFPADKFTQPVSRPDSAMPAPEKSNVAPPPGTLDPRHPHVVVSGKVDDSKIKKTAVRESGGTLRPGTPTKIERPRPGTQKPPQKPSASPFQR